MHALTTPKPKKSTPTKKTSKVSDNSCYLDGDVALIKAISFSLQIHLDFLDVADKMPRQISAANASSD